jgi:LPS-assembly protein
MLPPPQFRSQCLRLPKSSVASLLVSALLVATATTLPAQAQVTAAPEESSIAPAQTTPLPTQGPPIAFEADRVEYADGTESVTAAGNVVLRREGRSLKADSVTWSRKTGKITASGNVRLVDQDGNQLFVDKLDLTDEFETGSMENMLLALREGGRLAALSGERTAEGNILLDHAAYSACDVEDEHGCPKKPSWRVTSKKVVYEPDTKTVRFRGARLELFGIRLMPLPGLAIATDGRAVSGLLIPNFRFTPSNGLEISESYYQRLANNRDIAATAYFYTKAAPMASLQYRALTDKGAYQVSLYGTSSTLIPVAGTTSASQRELRGYVFANGRFQLSPNWSVTASLRRATDRTFLRRYDISRDDRLRSMIEVERIDPNSYLSIAGWATQTLRTGDNQGLVPVALPALDYWRRFAGPILGGKLEFHANSLGIMRTAGQDTQRAFASAQWDIRRLTNAGQVLSLTALVRGDVYHSSDNGLTARQSIAAVPAGRRAALPRQHSMPNGLWSEACSAEPRCSRRVSRSSPARLCAILLCPTRIREPSTYRTAICSRSIAFPVTTASKTGCALLLALTGNLMRHAGESSRPSANLTALPAMRPCCPTAPDCQTALRTWSDAPKLNTATSSN